MEGELMADQAGRKIVKSGLEYVQCPSVAVKCLELWWVCILLPVESYFGNWVREAQTTFSYLAFHRSIITSCQKCKPLTDVFWWQYEVSLASGHG